MALRRTLLLLLVLSGLPALQGAEDLGRSLQGPCASDLQKFCKNESSSTLAILGFLPCLDENDTALSYACRTYRRQLRTSMDRLARACQDDHTNFCADLPPGEGNWYRCIRSHKAQLRITCREELDRFESTP